MKFINIPTNKLKNYDADFLKKLAHLLDNGFTQKDALTFLVEQYEVLNKKDKEALTNLIETGSDLQTVLMYLGYHSSIIAQIRFSHVHGDVIKILEECHAYISKKRSTIKNLVKALQYPLILITLFIVILIALNYTVIPQFNILYESVGTNKSRMMNLLTGLLNFLPKFVLIIFIVSILFTIYLSMLLTSKNIKFKKSSMLRIPIINTYYKYFVTYKFSRELGFMFSNGIDSKEIINILKNQELDLELQFLGSEIERLLLAGESMSDAVKEIQLLDHRIIPFIKHGEYNSNVGKELILYSEYVLEGIIFKLEKLTRRIQPIIFIILGFLVICLYLVIVLPVFQMMSDLN
ncbi:competence type IV pilus assembly protein ComGB [Nosocomiicoccus ampullae]|uniref:Competence protein ComGB n=1 Tax=Nosocomiicoccus ampullae TaxID=489910 RepID=A0A9Q2HGJ4_9STAP|nr:competence type IV pilus assembly protein ComGB [Nosocomiicoccus ampullae]MBB5176427.1 competence protein ComGB [Nosocomiicoccus ampullae]QYA47594.1 type II secretion system F family protein [Nosocomiicoccus ampullae]QYA49224.1 type II secretion system F family protein [Nosocomiicoccus ampullae]